ncbi:replication initiation factor domain-containing protein [Flavobacterium franklandianum]|uniref:Replication initiation factor domain-containing protein n=1 Tax=Flavobacterium franklandianum TaxID=2594430 RepID=A0A553C8B5_9FLAO|nr:replication initiation factor domain-containing protein [Flavobacterium franklandianum]TRX16733.1 replication initiation factor domain-containing protein [Flavobacterium franklandianum]
MNQPTIIENQSTLINIDYLILNLEGSPFGEFPETSNFLTIQHDYGTKIFLFRADLYYKKEKIATFMHSPRSKIINDQLCQIQFENHLFYTISSNQLKHILTEFLEQTGYYFKSINRLDICLDKQDKENTYRNLFDNLISGNYLISGRPKNISSHFETYKGKSILNGFQIGKRTSDKLIRIYNKSLNLQITEKPYINEYFFNNNIKNDNIWRFEIQLNAPFFRDLKQIATHNETVQQDMTWGIFDVSTLFELLKSSTKGFFEVRENTGLSQVNKEKIIEVFNYDNLRDQVTKQKCILRRNFKLPISTTTIKKRLAKSLFREYYANEQDISYIIALNLVLEEIDYSNELKLKYWFDSKIYFYLQEFKEKDKILKKFDKTLFLEHQNLFL